MDEELLKQLGLRNYLWLKSVPGASDIDFVLEQKDTARVLIQEFKKAGERLPLGQRLLLKTLRRKGCDVWVVWEQRDGTYHVCELLGSGKLTRARRVKDLDAEVQRWWRADG